MKRVMPFLLIAESQGAGSLILKSRNSKNQMSLNVSDEDGILKYISIKISCIIIPTLLILLSCTSKREFFCVR